MTDTITMPEVTDRDVMFAGRAMELLPKWEDLTREEQNCNGPFCEAAEALFFSGGTLAEHGIFPKPGVELRYVMRYLRATMPSFSPKHEHKIGGVGHMLAKWCDHAPAKRHVTAKQGRKRGRK